MSRPPQQRRQDSAVGWNAAASSGGGALRRVSGLFWVLALLAMAAWSLFAWFAYSLADPVLAWLSTSAPALVDSGRGAVESYGGKAAGDALKTLDMGGLAGQAIALLKLVVKPAIVVIWVLGMVALAVLPMLMSAVRRLFGSRR
ncbi:hypothetical protein [Bosea beijingensis]|uniref:hypothetical protein n=1 Tax=Bosea beijingensis TaxID=3068632 RepID=UPI0027424826|nr:hypothetical protein [Bosea sp. REN20]